MIIEYKELTQENAKKSVKPETPPTMATSISMMTNFSSKLELRNLEKYDPTPMANIKKPMVIEN